LTVRETIRKLAGAGLPANQIAVKLRLAAPTVDYHLSRLRFPASAGHKRLDPQRAHCPQVKTREQVSELLENGLCRAHIARRLGVSKGTVSYHARRLGATVDSRCARRYDWAEIQNYYDAGN